MSHGSMIQAFGTVCGAALGAGTGATLDWFQIRPLPRSLAAGLLGWVIGSVTAALTWLRWPGKSDSVAAIGIIVADAALGAVAAGIAATLIHFGLHRARSIHSDLAAHRGAIVGLLGGLWGAVAFAVGFGLVRPVRYWFG